MFQKFVEVGRVVLVTYGEDKGKIAVIVDIVDHNRALVECPQAGVKRQVLAFKRMSLTSLKVAALPRGCGTKAVERAVAKAGLMEQWASTSVSKRLQAQAKRAQLGDFQRFQAMVLKRQKARVMRA